MDKTCFQSISFVSQVWSSYPFVRPELRGPAPAPYCEGLGAGRVVAVRALALRLLCLHAAGLVLAQAARRVPLL